MRIGRRFFFPYLEKIPVSTGFAYSAGACARSTSGIHQRLSADAFSVAVSI